MDVCRSLELGFEREVVRWLNLRSLLEECRFAIIDNLLYFRILHDL